MDIAGFWYRQARALRDPFDRLMAAYLVFTYLHIGGRKPKESERGMNIFNGSSFHLDDRAPRLARQGADVLIGLLSRILA